MIMLQILASEIMINSVRCHFFLSTLAKKRVPAGFAGVLDQIPLLGCTAPSLTRGYRQVQEHKVCVITGASR